jgi:hypothetical protein
MARVITNILHEATNNYRARAFDCTANVMCSTRFLFIFLKIHRVKNVQLEIIGLHIFTEDVQTVNIQWYLKTKIPSSVWYLKTKIPSSVTNFSK